MSQEQQQIFPYLQRLLNGAPDQHEKLKSNSVIWSFIGDENYVSIDNNRRKPIKSSLRIAGDTPYYGANNIQDYVEGYTHEGKYVLIAEDGTTSIENYSIQWAEGRFWANNHVHVIKGENGLNSRFLYYYLKTANFAPFLSGKGRPKLTKAKLVEIPIPIPPMEVQERIVEILDKFTELQAELQAELALREKQYIYFRDQLLSFDEGAVRWESLDQVFEIRNGYTPSKKQPDFWKVGTIPWYRMEDIRANGRVLRGSIQHITPAGVKGKGLFEANSIIMATTATIGEHALLIADSLANQQFTNFAIRESLKKDINHWFAFYYFFKICEWCKSNVYESSFPSVDMKKLKMLPFPIPPMEEQERIVGILDRFETMVHSIKEGLPREIELRRKQYEYFRDQLLTFPKD